MEVSTPSDHSPSHRVTPSKPRAQPLNRRMLLTVKTHLRTTILYTGQSNRIFSLPRGNHIFLYQHQLSLTKVYISFPIYHFIERKKEKKKNDRLLRFYFKSKRNRFQFNFKPLYTVSLKFYSFWIFLLVIKSFLFL